MNDIQKRIDEVFSKSFGRTPLNQRLEDIKGESEELTRFTDMRNLKEETGDLLASTIQLATECDWDFEELIKNTLTKISKREKQYLTLGRKTKVAILGGAFDPITTGHIRVAQLVLNSSKTFDEVWIMPAYKHMHNKQMTSSEHRLAMCELAAKEDGRIKVFDYEIRNKLQGETYNMLKRLQDEKFSKDEFDFSFIIGLDNANTFDTWVNYEHLERLIRFVVVPRKGVERIKGVDWYLKAPHIYLEKGEEELIEISSTLIRENIYLDSPVINLKETINPNVLNYIKENKLYV